MITINDLMILQQKIEDRKKEMERLNELHRFLISIGERRLAEEVGNQVRYQLYIANQLNVILRKRKNK